MYFVLIFIKVNLFVLLVTTRNSSGHDVEFMLNLCYL